MMAQMVPVGMDFWASLRSPDRFEPAMIPRTQQHPMVSQILNIQNILYLTLNLTMRTLISLLINFSRTNYA